VKVPRFTARVTRRERSYLGILRIYINDYRDEEATMKKLSTARLCASDNKSTCELGKFLFHA